MSSRSLLRVCLCLTFLLTACLPIVSPMTSATSPVTTSTRTKKSTPTNFAMTLTISPSPHPSTPTVKATVTPGATPVLAASPTLPPSPYALYQHECSILACTYEAWAEDSGGDFASQFFFASDREDTPAHSPAHALLLTYAHFADLVAYWTDDTPRQLWISDLDYQRPQSIYTDVAGKYPVKNPSYTDHQLRLLWSPDDRHLIVDAPTGSVPDLIYHIQNGKLEEWPWECDRVALSPRTGRLATWCPSTTSQSHYAVMEWGGEIWYSDVAPTTEIVRGVKLSPPKWIEALVQPWAWSADGQHIAYFDPTDADMYLHIAGASGERLTVLPGGYRGETFLVELEWSQDGRRLLVEAYGTVGHSCPRYRPPAPSSESEEAPCWQVLDTETGTVLWTLSDSAAGIMSLLGQPADGIVAWHSPSAVISPDGKLVALTLSAGAVDSRYVVNIETGQIKIIPPPVGAMRWGPHP